jgi:DNA-directed RNA polymerase subunit RPC12/RpoP
MRLDRLEAVLGADQLRLARCPACSSRLIYPRDLAGSGEGVVASRRCPECEHRDVVTTTALAGLLWFDRIVRERRELEALCDALADGLPLDPARQR